MSIAPTPAVKIIDTDTLPAPCREQRDESGRRIAVTFESRTVQPIAPSNDCWLVALDGSKHSMHALATAMSLASESGMHTLDLAHVQPWLSTEAAETEFPQRGWATAADARAMLNGRGFGWRLHVLMGEPAARIVELADALGSRGIVIGARGLSAIESLLLGSVAQRVIHTALGAVLVVRGPATSEEMG